MKFYVTVKANAKETLVEAGHDGNLCVRVKAPPQEGKANEAVIKALSEYFKRPKSFFTILAGHQSKRKLIELRD
jgi:uncharacterized protein (TIGR00251 family)